LSFAKLAHNFSEPLFLNGIFLEFVLWFRQNIFHKRNLQWLKSMGGMIASGPHPHTGKINAGEKSVVLADGHLRYFGGHHRRSARFSFLGICTWVPWGPKVPLKARGKRKAILSCSKADKLFGNDNVLVEKILCRWFSIVQAHLFTAATLLFDPIQHHKRRVRFRSFPRHG
jgi:hypothetical protein